MTLAEKIQKLRKEYKLSQDQLAAALDVSRQSVSKWELGDSIPEVDKILQLSNFFQVSTDYLLREDWEEDYCQSCKASASISHPANTDQSKNRKRVDIGFIIWSIFFFGFIGYLLWQILDSPDPLRELLSFFVLCIPLLPLAAIFYLFWLVVRLVRKRLGEDTPA